MEVEVTPEARDVLRSSLRLAGGSGASGIRLRAARGLGGGTDVQVELAAEPLPDEVVVEEEGFRIFIDPDVLQAVPNPVVAVEPQHEVVVVRPRT